jgi:hypothetical protein
MKQYLNKINKNQFKIFAVLACTLGDLFTAFYVIEIFRKERFINNYIFTVMKVKGIDPETLNPEFLHGLQGIVYSTASTVLFMFMLWNMINYFCYYREKNFAKKYVYFLAWTSIVLTGLIVLEGLASFSWQQLLNLFSIPLYLFVILGHRKFMTQTSEPQNENSPQAPNQG